MFEQHGPARRPGPRLVGLRVDFHPGEEVSARFDAIWCDPGRISPVITSQFYFDHAGGNAADPHHEMLVQRREREDAVEPEIAFRYGFNRSILISGTSSKLRGGEHEVFSECSDVSLPMHGHTPGRRSLGLRLDRVGLWEKTRRLNLLCNRRWRQVMGRARNGTGRLAEIEQRLFALSQQLLEVDGGRY